LYESIEEEKKRLQKAFPIPEGDYMKNAKLVIGIILTVLVILPLVFIYSANAYATATINTTVDYTPTAVGQSFTAIINIAGADSVWQWSINVNWNPAVLNATTVTTGDFLAGGGSHFFSPTVIDNVAGTLKGGPSDTLLTSSSVSGNGLLVKITFVVVGTGSSDITLSNVILRDNTPSNHQDIPYTLGSTLTINIPLTSSSPTPTPTSSASPTPTPSSGQPAIHVSTDKTRYLTGDLVSVTASVTHNGAAVANRDVAFTVIMQNNTNIATIVNTTNSNGVATISFRIPTPQPNPKIIFGNWSIFAAVEVAQVNVSDTVRFTVGNSIVITILTPSSVQRGNSIPINVTIENLDNIPQGLILTTSILDSAQVPLGMTAVSISTQSQGNITLGTNILIPQWAFTGQATVYVNLLTAPPQQGGVPYAPQATSSFQIT
jgi:hypothetical protein